MINIVIDNYIPYLKGALDGVANVQYLHTSQITNSTIKNCDALIIRTRTQCNKELLENTKVKFIASATIGYDHIDNRYCDQNNIKWTNAPGCNSLSVTQYMASVFSWLQQKKKVDLKNTTLGIVGVGSVGGKVEKLARALGMKVLLNDPPRARREGNAHFSTLKEVAEKADIITFHTWLDTVTEDKTYHIVDEHFFNHLKRKPIIINSARGEIVDTQALKNAFERQQISEIILDCWENEPNIDIELLNKCFIATPHIAGYSADGKANAAQQSVRAISRFFQLGIDDWSPEPLNDTHFENKIFNSYYDFFLTTYDIQKDSEQLKNNPFDFEKQRSLYPFRREPKAYPHFLPQKLNDDFWNKFNFF